MTYRYDKALTLAMKYHKGQVDKEGNAYIKHLIRVSYLLKQQPSVDETLISVALLHDIIEDTSMTIKELSEIIQDETIVKTVDILTRKETETYKEYIQRVKQDKLATIVKIADLRDHLERKSSIELPASLIKRYEKALIELKSGDED